MSAKKEKMTNAVRQLKAAGIDFEIVRYDAPDNIGDGFGESIAELTGIPAECSFKTLVGRGDKNGIFVCCIPVNKEADMKKAAKLTGNKRAELIHVKELLELTGYIRGGVSPIGMKKKYPTYFDKSVLECERAAVSGGMCGITVLLAPEELLKITDARTADIVKEE